MWKKLSRMNSSYEGMNCEFAEIRNREIGIVRPRNFSRRLRASEVLEISMFNFDPIFLFYFQYLKRGIDPFSYGEILNPE